MKLGIVGLPNVGKSTLFNSLTEGSAESANYPFCTIDPNIGVVCVPDFRLEKLSALYNSEKTVPAVIEFVDIAGLVKGASNGEGLGNKFLSHIREVDAIVHVVRCFEDKNIVHVESTVDPIRDIETINLELIFSDLEILERRIAKTAKAVKADKKLQKELDILNALKTHLEEGNRAQTITFNSPEETEFATSLNLLTGKPVLYAANVNEDDLSDNGASNNFVQRVKQLASSENSELFIVCAKIEEEIAILEPSEKEMFLSELGIDSTGIDKLISAGYKLLGLISFLTAGPKETKAWTIKEGTKAPDAADKIHSDIKRGFIRAEVVSYDDLIAAGSYTKVKEQGLVRSEGKEYLVKDGDVILFRFNV